MEPFKSPAISAELSLADWAMVFTRRLILALLRTCANAFLRVRPEDGPICPQFLWSTMMRSNLGFYAYGSDEGDRPARFWDCGLEFLYRHGVHATSC